MAEDSGEKDYSKSKNIGFACIVGTFYVFPNLMDFRCHVSLFGSPVVLESEKSILILELGGEAKICNFDCFLLDLIKDQNILQFEVAVGDSFLV